MAIAYGGAHEVFDGEERVERMVNELILVADLVEDDLRILGAPENTRRVWSVFQLRALDRM